MSGYLWKSYLENDVATFRAVLEAAGNTTRGGTQKSHTGGQGASLGIGGSGSLGKKGDGLNLLSSAVQAKGTALPIPPGLVLTRADINHRDSQGRTLLHLASSSCLDTALEFVQALLDHALTDIYLQDHENGWTALHRAFYEGNVAIAHAIIVRDSRDSLEAAAGSQHHPGGLIKVKDKEGNAPFDLFEMTLEWMNEDDYSINGDGDSENDENDSSVDEYYQDYRRDSFKLDNIHSLEGHEVYTFGNNKNITLGFGDEDDRQFPERIVLRRPEHLYQRFYEQYLKGQKPEHSSGPHGSFRSQTLPLPRMPEIPFFIRSKPITIHDVQMAKFSSAVVTTDPVSNLYICGHGSGGRLGLGDERTRFQFVCVEGGGLSQKEVVIVALGYHHTLALSRGGEVFSWGNNTFGQLGYSLPDTSKKEDPVQLLPRQIFGPLKKELICGIAASGIHSAVHTATSLFTFGKNEGQLGIVDSDARSLDMQPIPRRVGSSQFTAPIKAVSAIDKATVCLLKNHEVWVFANYGYSRVHFPLDWFQNFYFTNSSTMMPTRIGSRSNRIDKICSGGDTICALSHSGQVFTVTVSRPAIGGQAASSSTTNPSKIRAALSLPQKIWSNRKHRMAARDIDVDQNGSIILVTEAGSVWRRVKRAQIKDATASGIGEYKSKDYKFSRISGLTSVVAVRASGFGAYAAVRIDQGPMVIGLWDVPDLQSALLNLLPYKGLDLQERYEGIESPMDITCNASEGSGAEAEVILQGFIKAPSEGDGLIAPDLMLSTTTSEMAIANYQFIVAAGSQVIREELKKFSTSTSDQVNNLVKIKTTDGGQLHVEFQGLDILTVANFIMFLIWGEVVPLWRSNRPSQTWRRGPQVRTELLHIAAHLKIRGLHEAVRGQRREPGCLHALDTYFSTELSTGPLDPSALPGVDTVVQLADGEVKVHAALMCERCPFFMGLFQGRAGGRWLSDRSSSGEMIRIDLTHFGSWAFGRVLRWVYADQVLSLFEDVVADDLDSFLDKIIEVLSIADELMIKPLARICQWQIGKHINLRNVGQILAAIAPCNETQLKRNCLSFICDNLEAVLRNGQLEELDKDLLSDLDEVTKDRQCHFISRSETVTEELLEFCPDLVARIEQERQAKIDSIMLFNKYAEPNSRGHSSFKAGSFHEAGHLSSSVRNKRRSSNHGIVGSPNPSNTPPLKGQASISDLIFDMDDEDKGESAQTTPSKHGKATRSSPPTLATSDSDPLWKRVEYRGTPLPKQDPFDNPSPAVGSPLLPEPLLTPSKLRDPWQAPILTPNKLGMREIMQQASSSRTSNLSLGLSEKPPDRKSSGTFASGKMSQKERKKQQQQASLSPTLPAAPSPSSSTPAPRPSPWQPISKVNVEPLNVNTSSAQRGSTTVPHLTMRQTISNPGTPKEKAGPIAPVTSPSQPTQIPEAKRVPSSENAAQTPPTRHPGTPRASSSSHQSPVQIQSIRHTPRPARSSLSAQDGLSMADIQSQQQMEKIIAQDAVAKRSLQEIQAEQEFQEWWDKESARIQGEEAARDAKPQAKSGGSRGGRRRSGGAKKSSAGPSTSPSTNAGPSGSGDQHRDRGRGKGKASS